jgi:serine/threonine protein kinase
MALAFALKPPSFQDRIDTAFWIGLAQVIGTYLSYASERQSRRIFLQRRTIEEDGAKAEALLKRELSHQVAERSRELGDALSRVEGTFSAAWPVAGEVFHTRYRVVRALGEGGMGAVFEVERLTDTQHFALKVLTGRMSGTAAARFAREAEIGARLQHPNLVSIVDLGIEESGVPFLVMALVQGGSLEGRRARFGEVAWGLPILKQIALGLSALHEGGVVHRDLKPSNVLLDDGDPGSIVAKISDFGISRFGRLDEAKTVDPEGLTLGVSTPDLTGTGALLGTPAYMAPEAARGVRSLDAAADVFAIGVLAYEVLTGRAPFPTLPVLLARAGRPLPPPASIEDAAVGARACAAILACLAEDPRNRPSARSVLEALGASATG